MSWGRRMDVPRWLVTGLAGVLILDLVGVALLVWGTAFDGGPPITVAALVCVWVGAGAVIGLCWAVGRAR